jgi:hypothetical protein
VAEDDGTAGSTNPYQRETSQNTRTDWLADQKPLDVDIDGLVDYGKNMVTIQQNLQGHGGRLNMLGQLPQNAWEGGALPEGMYIRQQMTANYGELQQYLTYLGSALTNIGMAAQTVADAYSSTDGWSAASLDAVRFAFGEADAPRPAGLPPFITGKTWWDQYFEATASGQGAEGAAPKDFTDQGQRINPDGSVTSTAVAPDGTVKTITQQTLPGGAGTVVTTTTTDANGKVLSSSTDRTTTVVQGNSTVTTTTTTDAEGKRTGGSRETTAYGDDGSRSVTSEQLNAAGDPTSRKVDQHNADGTQTVTTTDGKGHTTQELHVGQNTDGVAPSDATSSPTKQALDEIKQHDYGI